MNATHFDEIATELAKTRVITRRATLGGMLGGVLGMLAREGTSAGKRKSKRKACKKSQTRCKKACVNLNTDSQNCGSCGNQCASGEQCLNGRCFSDDTCPFAQEACPNFRRCGIEDSDCFCGTTTGGANVCFQDEDFCELPRPCQSNNDCDEGRVCVDTSLCCEDRDLPEVPRTCLLPCENLSTASQLSAENARKKGKSGDSGPGR